MHDSWDELQNCGVVRAGIYLGDPRLAAVATARALQIAAIIASAPQFRLEDIEEDLFLLSLDDVHDLISDEEIN